MRYFVALLICVVAVSCQRSSYYGMDTWAKPYRPAPAQMAASDDDIRESVFRYEMVHNESTQGRKAHAYYLSVEGGQDPSDALIQKFVNSQTPVKKQSAALVTSQTPLGVHDKQTGLPGLVLTVDSIKRDGDVEAVVTGGYVEGGQSAANKTYKMRFRHGHWVVIDSSRVK
ncbi:MAG: hypothetical protein HUU46_22750 [Candidatus Hydrogenedentes bacterium]|nr:hypothetical protein [Candidatus Hydrogenedentota bacterium]